MARTFPGRQRQPARRAIRRLRVPRRWRRRLLTVVWVGLVVFAGVLYLGWRYGWRGERLADPAPAFVLQDHQGRSVALAEYLGRQPIVLIFYMGYG